MRTINTTTGVEISLDGDLLAIIETLFQEVTAKRQLDRSYEDMMREIRHLIGQMTDAELRDDYGLDAVPFAPDAIERPGGVAPEIAAADLVAAPEPYASTLRRALPAEGRVVTLELRTDVDALWQREMQRGDRDYLGCPEATIYRDAADADYRGKPEAYRIERRNVGAADRLALAMAPGGGCAVRFRALD